MFPTRSTVTVQPASVHQVTNRSRISLSESLSASRRSPPDFPGPISPDFMTVAQNRSPLTRTQVSAVATVYSPASIEVVSSLVDCARVHFTTCPEDGGCRGERRYAPPDVNRGE